VKDVEKVKDWARTLLVCLVVVGIIGLVVAMVIAGLADIFTKTDYGKWAIWGAGIGAVAGVIIGILIESINGDGGDDDEYVTSDRYGTH